MSYAVVDLFYAIAVHFLHHFLHLGLITRRLLDVSPMKDMFIVELLQEWLSFGRAFNKDRAIRSKD